MNFSDKHAWLNEAKSRGYHVGWYGLGSATAYNANDEIVGEWKGKFDCHNGVEPHGWLPEKV